MMLRLRGWPAARVPGTTTLTVFDTDTERYLTRLIDDEDLAQARFDLAGHTYERLERDIEHEKLPTCAVPDCTEKGVGVFIAAEDGRLAGRDWVRGDEIRVCGPHAADIGRAQHVGELAEWLRADARMHPLDAYDAATDPFYRQEWARHSILAVEQPGAA